MFFSFFGHFWGFYRVKVKNTFLWNLVVGILDILDDKLTKWVKLFWGTWRWGSFWPFLTSFFDPFFKNLKLDWDFGTIKSQWFLMKTNVKVSSCRKLLDEIRPDQDSNFPLFRKTAKMTKTVFFRLWALDLYFYNVS